MEIAALKVLVAGLITWIHVTGDIPIPKDRPDVNFVTHAELERSICHKSCEVLGFSPDDGGAVIYLDQSLDIEHNVCQRSILVHEIVHFMQHRDKSWDKETPVVRSHWREVEALRLQNAYLAQFGRKIFLGPGYAAIGIGYPYC